MISNIARLLAIFSVALASLAATAQNGRIPMAVWQPAGNYQALTEAAEQTLSELRNYRVWRLNSAALRRQLASAPQEGSVTVRNSPTVVMLPMPDGTMHRFAVVESSILSPELQMTRPNIRTYLGQGLDDGSATVRFGLTVRGFHAMVFFPDRTVAIQRVDDSNSVDYVSYFSRDFKMNPGDFACTVLQHPQGEAGPADGPEIQLETGRFVRTYRTIISSTGELTRLLGGVPQTEARIVELLNPTVGVYERDFNMRMQLVAFNIFSDPNTDPFRNGGSVNSGLLSDNINSLNQRFGSGAYDVGHVLCPGGGGVAFLRATCTSNKGGGVTGASGRGLVYHVGVLSHEYGHQFGANHSFNSLIDPCGPNRNSGTAYEPGSGSTIMAYPGLCGSDNVVNDFELYFHTISYSEAQSWRSSTGGSCGTQTATGNNPPQVNAGLDYTIPRQTPFILTMVTSDPDGDALTHVWEQFDLGTTDATRPLFRSLFPQTSPRRFMPNLPAVLANRTERWEALPTVNRTLNFRGTVRDNRAGAGGVNFDAMRITVSGDPFVVTSPNTAVTWTAGSTETITWTVGGGSVAANVNILLSVNGGTTFPNDVITLASNTPNDGSQAIVVPDAPTTQARVFIVPTNNIFYDVSNVNFTIIGGAPETVLPASYTVTRGVEVGSNDVTKIQQGNDSNPAVVQQQFQASPAIPNTELVARLTVPAGNFPTQATLSVRVAGNPNPLSTARREIALFNWGTGRFDVVETRNPLGGTGFETVNIALDQVQRETYIGSDGAVQAAVRMFQVGPLSPAWTMQVSLVKLDIRR
jgi:hypothetical protein